MNFHANHALGLPQRHALVLAIERGMSLKAAAAAFSVAPEDRLAWLVIEAVEGSTLVHCSLVTCDAFMADVIRCTRLQLRHRVELYSGRRADVLRLRDRLSRL